MTSTVLATICARGGSKAVPGKNIRPLAGRPLIAYTIDCARQAETVGHIVVSTDSDEIAAVAESCGISVGFRRPAEMASDTAPKVPTILHATSYVEKRFGFMPDIVVDLDITVPLRIPADIDSCVRVLESNPELDAAVSVYEAERNPYYNMVEYDGTRIKLVKTGERGYTRRQDAPDVYSVSGSTFGYKRSSLGTVKHLYEGKWGAYTIPRNRGIDIDTEVDFELVSTLLARRSRQLRRS